MDKLGCYMTTITGKDSFDCRDIMCNDCPYFTTKKEAEEKAKEHKDNEVDKLNT